MLTPFRCCYWRRQHTLIAPIRGTRHYPSVASRPSRLEALRTRRPPCYWNDSKHQRITFNSIAKALGIKIMENWYNVTTRDIVTLGAATILMKHSDSLSQSLKAIYPNFEWQVWRFRMAPVSYWENIDNVRDMFEHIGIAENIKSMDDWYNITLFQLDAFPGGKAIQNTYGGSTLRTLQAVYPYFKWNPNNFRKTPHFFWKKNENVVEALKALEGKLGISKAEDWYKITQSQVGKLVSYPLKRSYPKCLKKLYPTFKWDWSVFPSRQQTTERHKYGFWRDSSSTLGFLRGVENQLSLDTPKAWYRVSADQLISANAGGMGNRYLPNLRLLYPNYNWDTKRFSLREKKTKQRDLFVRIQSIFPGHLIYEEYNLLGNLSLDIYLPGLNLAFEYQGEYHYHDTNFYGLASMQKKKDVQKVKRCQSMGITLICIPYWNTDHDTIKLISAQRPDLRMSIAECLNDSSKSVDSSKLPRNEIASSPYQNLVSVT